MKNRFSIVYVACAVVLLAAAPLAGCDRPAAPGNPPASLGRGVSSEASCLEQFVNDRFGYRLDLPCGLHREVAFTNPGSTAEVIKQRVVFNGPGGADLVVDVWEDAENLSLDRWLEKFSRFAMYSNAVITGRGKTAGGLEYVQAVTTGTHVIAKDLTIVVTSGRVVRVMYVNTDGGASLGSYRRMTETFSQ